MSSMPSLQNLPFPIAELSWSKLADVQQHLKISKAEAYMVLYHVLGPKDVPWRNIFGQFYVV